MKVDVRVVPLWEVLFFKTDGWLTFWGVLGVCIYNVGRLLLLATVATPDEDHRRLGVSPRFGFKYRFLFWVHRVIVPLGVISLAMCVPGLAEWLEIRVLVRV